MSDRFASMFADIGQAAERAAQIRDASSIRQRGQQRRNRQRAMVGGLCLIVVVAVGVAAWPLLGMRHTANPLPATSSASTAIPSAVASPTLTPASPSASGKPTAGGAAAPATLIVTITGLPPGVTMAIGGREVQFTVTVSNPTGDTFANITLIVSTSHCTCANATMVPMAPDGTLRVQQPGGSWKDVFYDREGGGMDYIGVTQVPGFTLQPGESVSYTYRMGFNATQLATYHNGQLTLDATIVGLSDYTAVGPTRPVLPGRTIVGASPATSVPIQVTAH